MLLSEWLEKGINLPKMLNFTLLALYHGSSRDNYPCNCCKSNFGNLGAGCGAVEMVASILALHHGRLFPLLNYETPDPDCRLNVVRNGDVPSGDLFLTASITMQGQASCLAVSKFHE